MHLILSKDIKNFQFCQRKSLKSFIGELLINIYQLYEISLMKNAWNIIDEKLRKKNWEKLKYLFENFKIIYLYVQKFLLNYYFKSSISIWVQSLIL